MHGKFAVAGDRLQQANDIAQKENDDALEGIRKSGRSEVIILTDAQKAAWKKAMLPVHKENESRVSKEIIEAVYKETGFKP